MSDEFDITTDDNDVLMHASELLWKVVRSPLVTPLKLIRIAKSLYMMEQLPVALPGFYMTILLCDVSDYKKEKITRTWQIVLTDTKIQIDRDDYVDESEQIRHKSILSFSAQVGSKTAGVNINNSKAVSEFCNEIDNIDLSHTSYPEWKVRVYDKPEDGQRRAKRVRIWSIAFHQAYSQYFQVVDNNGNPSDYFKDFDYETLSEDEKELYDEYLAEADEYVMVLYEKETGESS